MWGWTRRLTTIAAWCVVACSSDEQTTGMPTPPDSGVAPLEHRFRKIVLGTQFLCEGADHGDFDGDGTSDVVSGPYWYEGPAFTTKHALYPAQAFDPRSYSDCFFDFVRDMNGDGRPDVVMVGFPGKEASWLENPGTATGPWPRHVVVTTVDGESPHFTDLTGDGVPELVFASGGKFGWASPGTNPSTPWTFHPLSAQAGFQGFTHGLGVGDVNGDGRADVLAARGYWTQPASLAGDPTWTEQTQPFGSGGAQMLVSDVDGDGDGDVITSLAAHGYGISWFEQTGASTPFVEHVVVPPSAEGDVIIHEPHALALHDIDGNGAEDFVAGERFWAHVPEGNPDFGAPSRLYWFQHVRDAAGVRFVPHLIDEASGVGTQVVVGDFTGDSLPDIVVGNKKGTFVFIHEISKSELSP